MSIKKVIIFMLVFFVIFTSVLVYTVSAQYQEEKLVSDIVGVTHVGGKYCFTTKDFLNEGADYIENLGTSVIKLWFSNKYGESYPYNSNWSQFGNISSMTDLAKTAYFQSVFSRPAFKTIILEASEFSNGYSTNFKDGLSDSEKNNVINEFKDLTVYLRSNQAYAGKTFILQNWESDNALGIDGITDPAAQDIAIQGMIDWLNARQTGINQGRALTPESNVNVAGAAEVNIVPAYTPSTFKTVIDYVIPYTNMDLYSYSDWATKTTGHEWQLPGMLDYIKTKAPDSAMYGEKNVYLGEFGNYEMYCTGTLIDAHTALSDATQRRNVGKRLELALKWGVKYAVYWELFCNGLRNNVTITPPQMATENQLKGVWLIRPDGSYTSTWDMLKSIMNKPVFDYSGTFEVENNTSAAPSGITLAESVSPSMSGAKGQRFNAQSIGDYVEYTLYVQKPDTYRVKAGARKNYARGIYQPSVEGYNFGSPTDFYSELTTDCEVHLGTVDIDTPGDKRFRFTVTGKNGASAGYGLHFDYIKLLPSNGVYEAEILNKNTNGCTATIYTDAYLSGGKGLNISASFQGGYAEFTLSVPETASYNVSVRYKKQQSGATAVLTVDGVAVGGNFDTYSSFTPYEEISLGTVSLNSGRRTFRVTLNGKNPSSSGYGIILDCIKLTKQ